MSAVEFSSASGLGLPTLIFQGGSSGGSEPKPERLDVRLPVALAWEATLHLCLATWVLPQCSVPTFLLHTHSNLSFGWLNMCVPRILSWEDEGNKTPPDLWCDAVFPRHQSERYHSETNTKVLNPGGCRDSQRPDERQQEPLPSWPSGPAPPNYSMWKHASRPPRHSSPAVASHWLGKCSGFHKTLWKCFWGSSPELEWAIALCLLEGAQKGKAVVCRGTGAGLQHDQSANLANAGSELALQGFWPRALWERECTAPPASPPMTPFNCKPPICSLSLSCQRRFPTPPEQTGAGQSPGQQPPRWLFVGLFWIAGTA